MDVNMDVKTSPGVGLRAAVASLPNPPEKRALVLPGPGPAWDIMVMMMMMIIIMTVFSLQWILTCFSGLFRGCGRLVQCISSHFRL